MQKHRYGNKQQDLTIFVLVSVKLLPTAFIVAHQLHVGQLGFLLLHFCVCLSLFRIICILQPAAVSWSYEL